MYHRLVWEPIRRDYDPRFHDGETSGPNNNFESIAKRKCFLFGDMKEGKSWLALRPDVSLPTLRTDRRREKGQIDHNSNTK